MSIVLPDVESLVVAYLKANAAVDQIVDGRVTSKLSPKAVFPAVRVTVVSDTVPIDWHLTGSWVQLDAFGTTREEARGLARVVHAEMIAWGGKQADGSVVSTTTINGVRSLPEPVDDRPRYAVDVRVWAHP